MHFWKPTKYPVVGSFVEHKDVVPQHMLTHVKTSVRLFSKGVGEDCWQLWESSRLIEDACKMLHRTLLRIKDVVPCWSMLFLGNKLAKGMMQQKLTGTKGYWVLSS